MNDLSHFDRLFEQHADPWRYRDSWYEERKRQLVLAALPRKRYALGYEPGCANGELAAALAQRCERFHASEGSHTGVDRARARLAALKHVHVHREVVPRDWPMQHAFDLIVISELGYYLDDGALDTLAACVSQTSTEHGTLLACHGHRQASDMKRTGDDVHARLARALGWPSFAHYRDGDFVLDVWSRESRSLLDQEVVS